MSGLLYKNWRQMFGTLMVILGTQVLCSITTIIFALFNSSGGELSNDEAAFVLFVSAFMSFAIFFFIHLTYSDGLFAKDEKHSVTNFVISAPTGLAGQIRSKYYFVFAEYIAFLFIQYITDVIVCGIVNDSAVSASLLIMVLFSIMLILTAVEIPFIVRFGSSHGLQVKGAALAVIVFIIAVYFLFGDISIFDEPDILAALQEKMSDAVTLGTTAVICGGAIPIYYMSYRISVKLYKKGAESYEN